MDDIDRANDQAQQILDMQLSARKVTLTAKGTCHCCEEILPTLGQLFCDIDCRDDYEKEREARRRNGNS